MFVRTHQLYYNRSHPCQEFSAQRKCALQIQRRSHNDTSRCWQHCTTQPQQGSLHCTAELLPQASINLARWDKRMFVYHEFLADTRCLTQQQSQHDQATAADLTSALKPDDSTRPAVRFQRDVIDRAFLDTGTGIDRVAGFQLAGLLRLKRSMTWPSESAITCATASARNRSSGILATLLGCAHVRCGRHACFLLRGHLRQGRALSGPSGGVSPPLQCVLRLHPPS